LLSICRGWGAALCGKTGSQESAQGKVQQKRLNEKQIHKKKKGVPEGPGILPHQTFLFFSLSLSPYKNLVNNKEQDVVDHSTFSSSQYS